MKTILKSLVTITLVSIALITLGPNCAPEPECQSQPWYADNDGDGYGDPETLEVSCDQPQNYVADNTDCDDTNPNIHPGAVEICNEIDDDCDGEIDEDNVCDPFPDDNGYVFNNTFYETPNAYIEFDEDPGPNEFNLFFTNGFMYDNANHYEGNTDDYLFSLDLSNWVFYNITEALNPSITDPVYPTIDTGLTYTGNPSDSVILHNGAIVPFNVPLMINGTEFGYGDDNDPNQVVHTPGVSGPFITINNYSFDATTQTGTIDVDYTFLDQNGATIYGHYNGNIGVIFD